MIRYLVTRFIINNIKNDADCALIFSAINEGVAKAFNHETVSKYTDNPDHLEQARFAFSVLNLAEHNSPVRRKPFLGQYTAPNVEGFAKIAHDAVIMAGSKDRLPAYRNSQPWRKFRDYFV